MIYRLLLIPSLFLFCVGCTNSHNDKPNILWLTCEDMSANHLSCYGNIDIKTPNIDALAAKGIRFTNAYSNGPQCSPARTTIINGMYAPTLMAEWHRKNMDYPSEYFYPLTLRKNGYHCTNASKTDYNSIYDKDKKELRINIWNQKKMKSLDKIKNPKKKPWFAAINFYETHMSRVVEYGGGSTKYNKRKFTYADPSNVHYASYLPHTDTISNDVAWHLEKTLELDKWIGKQLKILHDSGWAENTIIFFYSDHGGCLPGSKGYIREEGVKVPLIAYFPEKWAHLSPVKQPTVDERFVSFVDFVPTLYSILGIDIPKHIQGKPFAGKIIKETDDFVYLYKANQGTNFIPSRGITDGKYKIIWNYNTAYIPGGRNNFQWGMPGLRDWEKKYRGGKFAEGYHKHFFEPMEPIEFYDLLHDPDETKNLANDPEYEQLVQTYMVKLKKAVRDNNDLGFFPESMRDSSNNYLTIQKSGYDMEPVWAADEFASMAKAKDGKELTKLLASDDKTIRYWGAMGFFQLSRRNLISTLPGLVSKIAANKNENDEVRLMCAGALLYNNLEKQAFSVILELLPEMKDWTYALGQNVEDKLAPIAPQLKELYNRGDKSFYMHSILINCGAMHYKQMYSNIK
ncbi:MAG: sulfatase, partial [Bacteroidales bacterium]|nr:sulfatase [Bacteroidales bacterium]